jgi:hypothetical protein
MTVAELMKILKNKYEIPSPKDAELCFYFEDENGKKVDLKIKSIGAFDISTDIIITFIEDKEPIIIKPMGVIKPALRGEPI